LKIHSKDFNTKKQSFVLFSTSWDTFTNYMRLYKYESRIAEHRTLNTKTKESDTINVVLGQNKYSVKIHVVGLPYTMFWVFID